MTDRVKKILLFGTIAIITCLLLITMNFPGETGKRIALDTETGMTQAERKKDFNDLCKFIEKNVPFIYEYSELYGFGFEEIKDYYSGLVKNAENDYEYYALIEGFINNIPSGHMTMGYPNEDNVPEMYKFRTNDYPNFGKACRYWENTLQKKCREYYDKDYSLHVFYYMNGGYSENKCTNAVNNIPYSGARLLSVNGISVDEFIKLCPMDRKLMYDFQNEKPFRDLIIFNDAGGEECTIEYETKSGEVVSENAYYGTSGVFLNYIEYFRSIDQPSENTEDSSEAEQEAVSSIYTFFDEANSVMYLKFNDFMFGGTEALNFIRETALPDNIIIDLRDNTGGAKGVCDSLIGALSEKDIEFDAKVYSPNKYEDFKAERASSLPFESRFKRLYSRTEENLIPGESKKKYNIYVLVSPVTLSAADRFTSIVKSSGLGTIIGAFNTGGEAFGSPDAAVLEGSGLYFYFTDYKYINPDGTDNSVYGTAPDVYAVINSGLRESRDEMILQGINCDTYENRLKWDSVLIKTIESIKEEENYGS